MPPRAWMQNLQQLHTYTASLSVRLCPKHLKHRYQPMLAAHPSRSPHSTLPLAQSLWGSSGKALWEQTWMKQDLICVGLSGVEGHASCSLPVLGHPLPHQRWTGAWGWCPRSRGNVLQPASIPHGGSEVTSGLHRPLWHVPRHPRGSAADLTCEPRSPYCRSAGTLTNQHLRPLLHRRRSRGLEGTPDGGVRR